MKSPGCGHYASVYAMRGNIELWVRIPSLALLPHTIRATEPHSLYLHGRCWNPAR
nr:MAG TPA: hypothetical protein [Caudoviricetes sp.]